MADSYADDFSRAVYDVHPDGQWFLMVLRDPEALKEADRRRCQIRIILNWFEKLKTVAPVGR